MTIKLLPLFLLLSFLPLHASLGIEKFFKKVEGKGENSLIRNIDHIYLINLDQRPEKWEACLWQLRPYGIFPHRFSAIYGWDLPLETLQEIGLKFTSGMEMDHWVKKCDGEWDFLREACYGNTYFSDQMTRGAIGCTLSHLSVLQHAYQSNYQTIWVMEDDIYVLDNPYILGTLIDKLNALVGKESWDILYTDLDIADKPYYSWENDFENDLIGRLPWFWRPDFPCDQRIFPFALYFLEKFLDA